MTFDEWWAGKDERFRAAMLKEDMREVWDAAFCCGYEKGVAAFHEAVKMEREACANLAESWTEYFVSVPSIGPRIADAIRMRHSSS
jgi:hypothetical protein